ncbi:hypothetical protein DFH06DRAFT_1160988 [Mycena polygramma]|nr:hypothetical protein DFH06DRAFT_1160988 [Mycena polygramma]
MDGVPDLRARIAAISTQISVQKEVLKELERDKSLVQRQLNAALDPVARLPLEISSEIFLQTLPSIPDRPGLYAAPMLLLNVCHAWSRIALSTPALWAAIGAVWPCTMRFEANSRTWLQRAGNRPLSVSLRGNFHGNGNDPSFIWKYGERFKHLAICEEPAEDESYKDSDAEDEMYVLDFIEASCPTMPLLETLTICGSTVGSGEFYVPQIIELLISAPNLKECNLIDMHHLSDDEIDGTRVLPALRHLMFGESTEYPRSDDNILRILTLPALQTLRVALNMISGQDFLSFLRRSSPPLKELALVSHHRSTLIESLELAPALEHFEMLNSGFELMNELSLALTDSPSLLPDLRSLMIINAHHFVVAKLDCWEPLFRALLSRPKLRLVRVELAIGHGRERPAADMLARFSGLVKKGLQIYIGVAGTNSNFVSV